MPTRPILGLLAPALFAVALFAPAARAGLELNGSFESGPALPGGRLVISSGSTALTGWSVVTGSIEIVDQGWWQSGHLERSLGLNGSETGAVSQSIATSVGGDYEVRFWMAGDPLTVPGMKHMRVSAAGQSADYTFDSEHTWEWAMGWTQHVWSFTAIGTTTQVEFRSLDAGFDGPALDGVTVTGPTVSVGLRSAELSLGAPRPNPARGPVTIECVLPRAGHARLAVLDLQGREVATLADGELAAGPHAFEWSAGPGGARPGLYFVRLTTAGSVRLRRLALLH